ncbi:TPA: relaxosome protein TraM [Enterobacter hormaechei]|uniref:relaxosome protein TraM n=1 Tax=Enterobacter cloacae complex TaxID=354276 RepID=UPI0011ECE86C|nr:relaxosome protein TraM [Enterobacter hormaechei]KAA0898853.1 conjugal transfer protein [Enterobacter hormaechei]MCM7005257.1 conjugal transfer protein [Enterobacter hormaechei]MCM7015243.1 conjugal transfer protein [Enterobacter hormaechei]MCM7051819.1 conjugal transfer protein [Enterobacter hormaechei]HCU2171148.1 conjugal transfer protein [Enterobacter hormaechei]
MTRKNIYFKDKIDREIQDILEIELQKGATTSDMNYSSIVNELVRLGLMVYKSKEEGNSFDLEGFRRDLIKKVSGSREGIMILTALVSDIFVTLKGPDSGVKLEELINTNISAINDAEDKAEKDHFLTE